MNSHRSRDSHGPIQYVQWSWVSKQMIIRCFAFNWTTTGIRLINRMPVEYPYGTYVYTNLHTLHPLICIVYIHQPKYIAPSNMYCIYIYQPIYIAPSNMYCIYIYQPIYIAPSNMFCIYTSLHTLQPLICIVYIRPITRGGSGGSNEPPHHPQRFAVSNSTAHMQTLPRHAAFRDTASTRVR